MEKILQELPCNTKYIIAVPNRHRNPETFRRVRQEVMRQANVKERLYNLRHSWATGMLSEGVPMKTISEILGHSSVKVTEIYAKVMKKKLKKAIKKMPSYLSED